MDAAGKREESHQNGIPKNTFGIWRHLSDSIKVITGDENGGPYLQCLTLWGTAGIASLASSQG